MNLYKIAVMEGFDPTKKAKIVRHQDSNYNVRALGRGELFEFYQSVQSNHVFDNCEYIFSFLGMDNCKAVFVGLYRVLGRQAYVAADMPEDFPYRDMCVNSKFIYRMERVNLMEDLVDRMVIDWGKSTRNWYQLFRAESQKEVVEIYPKGYVMDFPGYDEVVVLFEQLEELVKSPDANRTWHLMLGSVAGIYLITDTRNGNQYIGSAYGEAGILGRWTCYVKTYHGNNKCMIDLLKKDPTCYRNFQFSILQTLPRSMNKDQVIRREQMYKKKLGSRAFGMNSN